mgnify:CR=1 FL=1
MRRGSRIKEDEVLSDRNRTLLLCAFAIALFSAGFREARAALRNARVLPAAPPLYPLSCVDDQASASVRRPDRL